MVFTFRDKTAMSAVLQKTDRILSDVPVMVDFFDDGYGDPQQSDDPPSYVIGNLISVSTKVVEEYQKNSRSNVEFMSSILGLNYHELSHILFTPQKFTKISEWVSGGGLFAQYNALEDQRIENMFCAEYSSAHRYFTFTVLTHIIDDKNPGYSFPLVYGRKYLPKRVRSSVEDDFSGPDHLRDRFKSVIDRYINIPYPDSDHQYAYDLVVEYAELLWEWRSSESLSEDIGKSECATRKTELNPTYDDRKREVEEENNIAERSRQAQQKRAESESEDESEDGESQEEGDGDDSEQFSGSSGSESEGEESEENTSDGSGSGDSEEEGESSDNDSQGQGSGEESDASDPVDDESDTGTEEGGSSDSETGASGVGDTPGERTQEQKKEDAQKTLNEETEKILDDPQLNREVKNTSQSYQKHRKELGSSTQEGGDDMVPVTRTMRIERNHARKEIGRILDQVAPGWKYGSHSGVINVPRYLQSEHGDEDIWDAWDEGREEDIGCEVFISLDCSASMRGERIQSASAALWVMKSAFDELGVDTLVTTFGDPNNERVLYGRGERVNPNEHVVPNPYFGCTLPHASLEIARDIMKDSKKKSKLFISITDGSWSSTMKVYQGQSWQDTIREMSGVTKMLISVEMQPDTVTTQEFDHVYYADSSNLVSLGASVRDVVMSTMRGKVR